jgi:xylulokinase
MKDLVLGIDIGTTGVKAIVVKCDGFIFWESHRVCELISRKVGFSEEDPNIWWENTCSILRELSTTEYKDRISAIGLTGMVPTLILVDEKGNPLRNSIQQNDARAVEEIKYIKRVINEDEYFSSTGNTINQQIIPPKYLWLKKYEPQNLKRARYIMGSYDFISFKLTGIPHVELNWALESGLWMIREKKWHKKILDVAEIPEYLLPTIYKPIDIVGETTEILPGIPVIAGSADHIASALGMGIREEGDLLLKIGGAGDILFVTDSLKIDKRLFLDYHDIPKKFVLNGCMASSGSIVKWFRNNFTNNLDFSGLDKLAEKSRVGAKGLVMLPYFLGEKTPIFDPIARGVILGLGLHHKTGDIFRAILESIAFGFRHHIDVIEGLGFPVKRVLVSNGGARSSLWKEIVIDVIGMDAKYIKNYPGSSLGVAFLAGMACGLFKDWAEIDLFLKDFQLLKYDLEKYKVYSKYYEIYKELYPALKPFYEKIYEIEKGN